MQGLVGVQLNGGFTGHQANVMMSGLVSAVDCALQDAPGAMKDVTLLRYFLTGADVDRARMRREDKPPRKLTDEVRARLLGISRREYIRRVDMLLSWMVGRVGKKRAA